jgi:hypothetical protein
MTEYFRDNVKHPVISYDDFWRQVMG